MVQDIFRLYIVLLNFIFGNDNLIFTNPTLIAAITSL